MRFLAYANFFQNQKSHKTRILAMYCHLVQRLKLNLLCVEYLTTSVLYVLSASSQSNETCASKCQSLPLGDPSLYKRLNTGPCRLRVTMVVCMLNLITL